MSNTILSFVRVSVNLVFFLSLLCVVLTKISQMLGGNLRNCQEVAYEQNAELANLLDTNKKAGIHVMEYSSSFSCIQNNTLSSELVYTCLVSGIASLLLYWQHVQSRAHVTKTNSSNECQSTSDNPYQCANPAKRYRKDV
jgi:hypothetical protein